jgi:hypothetical protein
MGYHLRRTDQVLTAHFADTLRDSGLTRFHWQVLNTLAAGGAVGPSPFLDDEGLAAVLGDLRGRGWVGGSSDAPTLTDAGREGHREVARQVEAVRERAMRGVSERDYVQLVTTLQRIVRNLEPVT